jgi:hypothetical protein
MSLRLAATSDDRARAIRDHVMPLLREHGNLLAQRDVVRMIELRRDLWIFQHWTPFNDPAPDEAASPGYRRAIERQHTRPDLPYGLDIWHGVHVLRILWADDDAIDVAIFVRGDWEKDVLTL